MLPAIYIQALAQEKARAVLKQIGYPDWLPDNNALDKYYENVIHIKTLLSTS